MKKLALTDKGKGWAGVTIRIRGLVEVAARIVAATKWRGPLRGGGDARRGRPSTTSSRSTRGSRPGCYLATGAGVNLPRVVVELARGEVPAALPPYQVGEMFVRISLDQVVDMRDFERIVTTGEIVPARPSRLRSACERNRPGNDKGETHVNTAQPYERPGIVRHQMGAMNKFGQRLGPRVRPTSTACRSPIWSRSTARRCSSSRRRTLVERYRELDEAFSRRYPPVRIAWSYKTNYLEAICRVFHREGAWAEVVSPFEYDKAVALGVPPERIHFNGPYKPDDALERAIARRRDPPRRQLRRARAHRAHRQAARAPRRASRSASTWRSRASSRGAASASTWSRARRARRSRACVGGERAGARRPAHPHRHVHPRPGRPTARRRASWRRSPTSSARAHGVTLSFIDLGGGFASPTRCKSAVPARASRRARRSRATPRRSATGSPSSTTRRSELPTLVLETGRALVDDAGYLISTVQATKRLPDGRRGAGARRGREPALHRVLVQARRRARRRRSAACASPPSCTGRCA